MGKNRTKGQFLFVLTFALTFILSLMGVHLIFNFQEVMSVGITYFLESFRFFVYIIMGFGYGFYKWSRNEKKYQSAA